MANPSEFAEKIRISIGMVIYIVGIAIAMTSIYYEFKHVELKQIQVMKLQQEVLEWKTTMEIRVRDLENKSIADGNN